jgi:hypothetical protein
MLHREVLLVSMDLALNCDSYLTYSVRPPFEMLPISIALHHHRRADIQRYIQLPETASRFFNLVGHYLELCGERKPSFNKVDAYSDIMPVSTRLTQHITII